MVLLRAEHVPKQRKKQGGVGRRFVAEFVKKFVEPPRVGRGGLNRFHDDA